MTHPDAIPPRIEGVAATPHSRRYLSQLCKHFQHRCPVTLAAGAVGITFAGMGTCRLRADEATLTMILEPLAPAQAEALREVVVRHLRRFAFREELAIEWRPQA